MKKPSATSPQFERLQPTPNLVEQVVEQLREQVVTGRFQPDEALPSEGRLAEQFGVSRTVLREAMHQLRYAGLIEVSHGRRPRVKAPNADASLLSLTTWMQRSDLAIDQLLEVRRPIECEIVRLATTRGDAEMLRELRNCIDRLRKATTMARRVAFDALFHRQLAEAAGNPIFLLLLDALNPLLVEQRRRTLKGRGAERAAADHEAILDRIEQHDPAGATQAMMDHLIWPHG
ncbi:FadR/GntR family transcriptional regulator [Phycisphaerales bacterium AB-hyl4]|uniref:FadR/GntR family transcriptional regulator n=1 Tax=Natronomicrosphaera hydrolytica TaxID=3242702 RepID=A0ABV4UBI8_9BACT